MGRRALRKIDPTLDLTPYLFEWDDLPEPFRSAEFFGRPAPLEVEVGSGKGLFMATAAAARDDHNFLGIEIARKYARYTAARLAKRQLTNAKMLAGDAVRFFHEKLADESTRDVHVYFPDPWWKKRHRKRRVMQGNFVRDIQRVLEPGGRLHFWTDVEAYFRESLDILCAETNLHGPLPVPVPPPEHDLDYRTHFERRMRLHDEAVFRAAFIKE